MKNNNIPMHQNNNKYFGADESEKTAAYLLTKGNNWFSELSQIKYLDTIRDSWMAYHGCYHDESHAISFSGSNGELINIAVNHYRNIAQNILVMVTSTRPAFQARAINTDYKSQVQTKLANGLLEYYMREKRLEKYLKRAVEYAIVLGSGYIKMEWNSEGGEIYDWIEPEYEMEIDPDTGDFVPKLDEEGNNIPTLDENGNPQKAYPVREGDVVFKNLSPYDVVFDTTREDTDHEWVLVRTFKNKYDLATQYPEYSDQILALETKSQKEGRRMSLGSLDETFDVPVYEFFHKSTETLPQGRYMVFLSSDLILSDLNMPYSNLPVYRIAPSDILGTPFGYTPMFDLLPLQNAVNSLYSTVLTNQTAFGVQSILNPRGNDIRLTQLEGGLNFIEYNALNGIGKPEPLNLTQTPAEIFNFMGMIERQMEIISGVSSVVRGSPESSLRSGNALALVQSQALQFMSGLQQSYINMIEDIGTGLINLLKDFASAPRVAAIAGHSSKVEMTEFKSEDLSNINRVIVDVGNALSQSTAGRVQMAEQLLQMGLIKNPNDYFLVMNSGNLNTMTANPTNDMLLIRSENEALVSGETPVVATAIDSHAMHINEHKYVISDPSLRLDEGLVQRVLAHIQEHILLLQQTDPNLLAVIGEQSMQQPPMPPQGAEGQGNPSEAMMNPEAGGMGEVGPNPNSMLPQPAEPPASPDGMPMSPEEMMAMQGIR